MRRRFSLSNATLLDRAILAVAPQWGIRRIASRSFIEAASNFAHIEAAERNVSRGDRWMTSRLSPDSQLDQDLVATRDHSREIYQNDAMGGVVESKVNHVIGTGHSRQARIRERDGVITADQATEYNNRLEEVYDDWSLKADKTGRRSVWMLSRLAERHNEFDGESFTVLSDVGRADKVLPLTVQVIDPERVETPPKYAGDPNVRLGIRYDNNGYILGYYVRKVHPGDLKKFDADYDVIPAERMLHVFEPWFAEQSRGLPWMTRALNRAKDAKDYDEAAVLGAQIEQCYAAFVKTSGRSAWEAAGRAATGSTKAGRVEDLVPGTITYLDDDEEVTFGSPNRPGNGHSQFMEWNYRRVAAAINWPYEMVVKNWNELSFAAGRLVLTDAKKATEVSQKIMRELWFAGIWNRMVEECVILGEVDISPVAFYNSPHLFTRHTWIPPRWDYAINPNEDNEADVLEIDENLALLEEKLAKRGYDFSEFVERRQREIEQLKTAGMWRDKSQDSKSQSRNADDTNQRNTEDEPEEVAA